MSDELDKLIAAVEAGTLTGDDDLAYPDGVPEMIDTALGMDTIWDTVCLAHDGSLDEARMLHRSLLNGWLWGVSHVDQSGMPYPHPKFWVQNPDVKCETSFFRPCGMTPVDARSWLLAILRAYRATLTASAR